MATGQLSSPPADNANVTSVTSSITSVLLLAANGNRVSALIRNDSNSRLFIIYGTTASVALHTERIPPQKSFIVETYKGRIDGIWAPVASGSAKVTEEIP